MSQKYPTRMSTEPQSEPVFAPPSRELMFAEGPRALAELASLFPAAPLLSWAPRGDGHPVLVFPGLGGSDRSTRVLRGFLAQIGYAANPWNLGQSLGSGMSGLRDRLAIRLDEVYRENGERKVSLAGWSLGGVYARLLAHLYPDKVRQVVTIGSPIAGSPKSTRVYKVVRRMTDGSFEQTQLQRLRILATEPLPNVPSTAIFSKTDGIVPWQIAMQQRSSIADNIEVYGSHIGLGFNPTVLFALADRLANAEGDWRRFQRTGWKRLVYGPAHPFTGPTAA